jgi:hypothetical protein
VINQIIGEQPPEYNLENIRVPTAIFLGSLDTLSVPRDSEILLSSIPNVIEVNTYEYEFLTFLVGLYMGYLNDVLRIIEDYSVASSI